MRTNEKFTEKWKKIFMNFESFWEYIRENFQEVSHKN